MGWGTYYTYDGYPSRITKDEIPSKLEENQDYVDTMWREILAYASSTPPAEVEDEEGNKMPYPEFIASKIDSYRKELEETYWETVHLQDCEEAKKEKPESVTEG